MRVKFNMRVTNTMSKTVRTLAVVLAVFCAVIALGFVAVPQAQAQGFPMHSWGNNTNGLLGRPVTVADPANLPGRVDGRADWMYSATALVGSFAINRQGHLYAWGNFRASANMGQGGTGSGVLTVPTRIETASSSWVSVSARSGTVAAINSQGQLFTWGSNIQGQLGHGDTDARSTPTQVGTRTDWERVSVGGNGGNFMLAITTSGHLYAWGNQTNVISNQSTPIGIGSANNWTSISTGGLFAVAINSDGELFTWGGNVVNAPELGRTPNVTFPQNQPGPVDLTYTGTANDWIDVRTTNTSAAAINASGYIYTWGEDTLGQLGRPVDIVSANRPGRVGTDSNWVSVMGGNSHFLAFNSDRELWAWGNNSLGQLGIGAGGNQSAPYYVTTVQRFSSAARGGGTHSIMLLQTDPVILDLTKHLRKPEGTPNPEAEFTFNVVRHAFNGNETLYDRLPEINPIVLRPSEIVNPNEPNPAPAGIITREDSVNIFDGVLFTEPGRFTFRVGEVEGSSGINTPPTNSTVVYSLAVYEICVLIVPDPFDDTMLIEDGIIVRRIIGENGYPLPSPYKPDNITFVNTYTRTTTGTNDYPGALSISKRVVGFADPEATFNFDVTITRTALCPSNRQFVARVADNDGVLVSPLREYTFTTTPASASATLPVGLGHNEQLVFDELIVGTRFTAAETIPAGFTASVVLHVNGTLTAVPAGTPTLLSVGGPHIVGVNRNSAAFTNTHDSSPSTGLVLAHNTPYVALFIAVLAGVAVVTFNARRRIEDLALVGPAVGNKTILQGIGSDLSRLSKRAISTARSATSAVYTLFK